MTTPINPAPNGPQEPAGTSSDATGAADTGTDTTGAQSATQDPSPQGVDALPDWAQKEIKTAREYAARQRREAKAAKDATAQQSETVNKLMAALKAAGLPVGDDEPDPAQVADQLTRAQADAKAKAVELAVYRAAAKAGVDGDALLDSRSFLDSVSSLDLTANTFAQAVEDAVKGSGDRFKTNPQPQKTAPTKSGGDFNGAPNGKRQLTEADVARMSADEIDRALADGQLSALLGTT
ncbi:hypothetical protein ABZ904_18035 [Streptomyces sp. NPDC046900]|uniref:hypothetical protein n=1 Tax=Streptomyces sp. NPDC046900 TaxID=3155473 RepID=UPI0033D6EDE8